jgi:hypothetical protein
MRRLPTAPLWDVLARVYHSLRNSMHVSAIGEPAEVEVAEIGQLGGTVVNLLYQTAGAAPRPTSRRAAPVQPPRSAPESSRACSARRPC